MQGQPTAVTISFLVSGVFIIGWMIWGLREYRRTGRAMWLWLGCVMAISLAAGYVRFPR